VAEYSKNFKKFIARPKMRPNVDLSDEHDDKLDAFISEIPNKNFEILP